MVAKILDNNNEELKQERRRKTRRTAKTTTLHVHHGFFWLHFLAVVARLRHMELPNFTRPLYGVGQHSTKIFLFLTHIRSFRIQPQEFCQH